MDLFKEIIFGTSDTIESKLIAKAEKNGKLRKITSRLYTTNMVDSLENIVKRHLIDIIAWRLPGAIISHRSAVTLRPTEKGNVYITYTFNKRIDNIPGIILNVSKGHGPIGSDIKFGDSNVYASSEYRWFLEIMQKSRTSTDGDNRSFSQDFVEKRLDAMITAGGMEKINAFRDNVRRVSIELDMKSEFEKLNKIISALLSTHDSNVLRSTIGKRRSAGFPIDPNRTELFQILYDHLNSMYFKSLEDTNKTEESFRMFGFFESYFSNYIEGTEFSIEEAKKIVDTGIAIPKRTADSHDILGAFRLTSSRFEMNLVPQTEEDLLNILRHRHAILMEGRPECHPGEFKKIPNRAGNTEFVDPTLVVGTLRHAFKMYCSLKEPFAKAVFMMFVCSEIHPFTDGNGRVSRLMMNAELVHAGQFRIIVPTAYREDYIIALRKLSRNKQPDTYVDVMSRLHKFSSNLFGEDFNSLNDYLKECNAYEKPEISRFKFIDRIGG
ncbi:MAG: Fic family protein [Paludibacteraceae bacterium]|nr:Fic family protein [Paludibacteraceae bacterium]